MEKVYREKKNQTASRSSAGGKRPPAIALNLSEKRVKFSAWKEVLLGRAYHVVRKKRPYRQQGSENTL